MKISARFLPGILGVIFALSPFAAYASPLTISSCNDLEKIASSSYPSYTASSSYVLTQNIDCTATATQNSNGSGGYYGFTPIPDFTGTFNGAGYAISNLYISTTTSNVGLFSSLDGTSTVENLTLSGGSVSGGTNVGAVAGQMIASSTVQNVTSSVSVTDTGGYLGGLVGYGNSANASIASSSASGAVTSSQPNTNYFGGLVGDTLGSISSSIASAPVTISGNGGNEYIGGLAGYAGATVSNSYATGNVIASGASDYNVGGLLGSSGGTVTTTYETGSVTANGATSRYIAGLIGQQSAGSVASSSAIGPVTATGNASDYIAGFAGASAGSINNSFSTSTVTATTTSEYTAGFVGDEVSGTISECYASGNVIGGGYVTGGFVGASDGTITKSFEIGNVTVMSGSTYGEYIGGFAGYSDDPVDNTYSTGNVSIPISDGNDVYYAGGYDGYTDGTVTNSYATGSITGSTGYDDVGGFIGYDYGSVINSYSTGAGNAIASTTSGTVGYFLGETSNQATKTNDAVYAQGTPAIGEDDAHSSSDALLATHGYGTDESTLSNFYNTTEAVYAQASTSPWNFSSIWTVHANALPTFQWYSGVTPTYTITATAGTGGQINNSGAFIVQGGANQSYTIIPNSGYTIANVLVDGTSVGAVSTYTFTNVGANHTISVTFDAPVVSSGGSSGGGSSGGGTVQNQVSNLLATGNTTTATALMQQYPTLFSASASGTSASSSSRTSSVTISTSSFTRSLTLGSTGADVKLLQEYLNAHGFTVAATGAGSLGHETTYFGKATRAALARFQKANGITPAAGYFGSITRAYVSAHP